MTRALPLRPLVICLAVLLLTACNEVTGDESGGVIHQLLFRPDKHHLPFEPDKIGPFDAYLPRSLLDFRDQHVPTMADLIEKANSHCLVYGKQAKVTEVDKGRMTFECM